MLSNTICRHVVTLSLAVAFSLSMTRVASGQQVDMQTPLESHQRDGLRLALQPGPEPEAQTPGAPDGAANEKRQPPSPADATQPDQGAPELPLPPVDRFPSPPLAVSRSPILRLASVPNMLGDFFNQGAQLRATAYRQQAGNEIAMADVPIGGGRRSKIAENNKPLPMNRCYFIYQHFHNALDANSNLLVPGNGRAFPVDRYMIGLEKTFLGDCWSVDVRMPFSGGYGMNADNLTLEGGEIGNLAITLKRLLVANDCGAVAAGLGIDVPTGSDATGRFEPVDFTVRNEAVHLSPYLGFLSVPSPRLFCLGFAQLDVAANGNRIDYLDTTGNAPNPSGTFGVLTEQTLLYLDLSAGYWLYRNPCSSGVTGLASVVEFHYTTTFQDADLLASRVAATDFQFGNLLNRVDVVNLTVGLEAEIRDRTTLRVGGIFPLNDGPEKPFDAEVHVSVDRRF